MRTEPIQKPLLMVVPPKPWAMFCPHCDFKVLACSEGRAVSYLTTHIVRVHQPQGEAA